MKPSDNEAANTTASLGEPLPSSRPPVPHPVDHTPGREDTYVPATRSTSYLRNAVAEISPETVAHFDKELREDTAPGEPGERLRALRGFLLRWIEYIAIHGDHTTGRHIDAADTPEEHAHRYSQARARVRREHFPDAADDPDSLRVRTYPHNGRWRAVCPITMIRCDRDTEEAAQNAMHAALSRLLSGM